MVNDNEIAPDTKTLTHDATSLFIQEDSEHNIPPQLYDLDLEFSNTKKNKNLVTIISLIVFTLIFVAAAYFVTKYIEYQNSQIPISIDAFEDVNLREIFDKAKQHDKEMKNAQRELKDLISKKESAILELDTAALGQIEIIKTDNPVNKTSKISRVQNTLKEDILRQSELFDGAILQVESKIDSIQTKIDSYDTRIVEKAKEQEELINNQQKRFDMEMEKSVSYYEEKIEELKTTHKLQVENIALTNTEIIKTIKNNNELFVQSLEDKYNPEIEEEYFNNINTSTINIENLKSGNIGDIIYNEGLLQRKIVDRQLKEVLNANQTFDNLKKIPYYNYPEKAINYLEYIYHGSVGVYTDLIKKVEPKIKEKNSLIKTKTYEIEQLDYFLSNYVKTNRVNGLVIDPRNRAMKVFIDPIYTIKENSTGLVFRNDSDYIGKIKFRYSDGVLTAEVLQLANKSRGLEPFDMILINLK